MYYYLIVVLQVFCIYHAYKNGKPYYWYFLIFFIPILGSIIYSITQVYNKTDAEKISAESHHITKPNRRIYRNTILEVERLLKTLKKSNISKTI